MTENGRNARNAYRRAWAKKNPEKIKEYQRKYWEKRAEEAENKTTSEGEKK